MDLNDILALLPVNSTRQISSSDLRTAVTALAPGDDLWTPQDFTPGFDALDTPASYTLAVESGSWGAPSHGKYQIVGGKVQYSFRIVTGALIDDFNPGAGHYVFDIPTAIDSSIPDLCGDAHIVLVSGGGTVVTRISSQMCMDPVYDDTRLVMFLDGESDFIANTTLVSNSNPFALDANSMLLIFLGSGSYWLGS